MALLFPSLLAVVAVIAGGIAAVSGFGIGSLLTPTLALQTGTEVAVAAMLGFDVPKEAFVATATAIAIFVDVARLPAYLASGWRSMLDVWPFVLIATIGAVAGTALGTRVLGRLPQSLFRTVVALLLLLLGIAMLLTSAA